MFRFLDKVETAFQTYISMSTIVVLEALRDPKMPGGQWKKYALIQVSPLFCGKYR